MALGRADCAAAVDRRRAPGRPGESEASCETKMPRLPVWIHWQVVTMAVTCRGHNLLHQPEISFFLCHCSFSPPSSSPSSSPALLHSPSSSFSESPPPFPSSLPLREEARDVRETEGLKVEGHIERIQLVIQAQSDHPPYFLSLLLQHSHSIPCFKFHCCSAFRMPATSRTSQVFLSHHEWARVGLWPRSQAGNTAAHLCTT